MTRGIWNMNSSSSRTPGTSCLHHTSCGFQIHWTLGVSLSTVWSLFIHCEHRYLGLAHSICFAARVQHWLSPFTDKTYISLTSCWVISMDTWGSMCTVHYLQLSFTYAANALSVHAQYVLRACQQSVRGYFSCPLWCESLSRDVPGALRFFHLSSFTYCSNVICSFKVNGFWIQSFCVVCELWLGDLKV